MSNAVNPPPLDNEVSEVKLVPSSVPPQAKTGRAIVDAIGDALQNLAIIGVASYAWLVAGKIDEWTWIGIVGAVAGLMNAGSVLDRLVSKRVSRGALHVGVGLLAGKGTAAAAAVEIGRRTIMVLPLVIALGLGGCAFWNETAKPVLRTIFDFAHGLCLLSASEQDATSRDGLTPDQFCAIEANVRPFVEQVLRAKQAASAKAGLTSGGEVPPPTQAQPDGAP